MCTFALAAFIIFLSVGRGRGLPPRALGTTDARTGRGRVGARDGAQGEAPIECGGSWSGANGSAGRIGSCVASVPGLSLHYIDMFTSLRDRMRARVNKYINIAPCSCMCMSAHYVHEGVERPHGLSGIIFASYYRLIEARPPKQHVEIPAGQAFFFYVAFPAGPFLARPRPTG